MLVYLRELVVSLPLSVIKGFKHFGWRGAWLAICDLVFQRIIIPVKIPGFGVLRRREEARSLIENFCMNELRCDEVEKELRTAEAPAIVDMGVNLGMSIAWWFRQNPKAHVTGVEMMQESLDYTKSRLDRMYPGANWTPVCCAAAASDAAPMTIRYTDPLEGTTSAAEGSGDRTREVPVRALDSILADQTGEVLLLKCDIEGYGGFALQGAKKTLARTRYVVTETHGAEEMSLLGRELSAHGFAPFQLASRSLWWRKFPAQAQHAGAS